MPKQIRRPNPAKVREFVAWLRNSDQPTVIVEGADDMRIFRRIEGRLGSLTADVLPEGGSKRSYRLSMRKGANTITYPLLFWPIGICGCSQVFLCITTIFICEKSRIALKIDLYAGVTQPEDMLDPQEAEGHRLLLDLIVEWFAFEVEEHLSGRCIKIDQHCDEIVKPVQTTIDEGFRERLGLCPPDKYLREQIRNAYQLELRGKTLFEVLARILNSPGHRTNYSKVALLEIAFKMTSSFTH